MKIYKNCQSCGMPMKKDPEKGGTESDGSRSLKYCSYCYSRGAFTEPDMHFIEMKIVVKRKLREMGYPEFITGFFTSAIPELERWKKF